MVKDWIAYWMERGETAERAAYLAKGSEALASHAVFRVFEDDSEGCQCVHNDIAADKPCPFTLIVSVYSRYEGFDRYDAKHWKEAEFREHCGSVCVDSPTSEHLDFIAAELAADVACQIEAKRLHDSAQACLYFAPACTVNHLSARCAA